GRSEPTAWESTPICSSPSGEHPRRRPSRSAGGARSRTSVSSTPCGTARSSASGAACPSGSAAASAASAPSCGAAWPARRAPDLAPGPPVPGPPDGPVPDPGLDGGGAVDPGPLEELLGALVELRARDEPDQLDRRHVGAVPAGQLPHG